MLYVFHGEDEFSRSEAIAQMRQKMDPVVGDLNTAVLDGRGLSLSELRAACDTMPFMGDRRLVIVHDLISSSAGGKGARGGRGAPGDGSLLEGLEAYVPQAPESARLVLDESRSLPKGHRLLRLASEHDGYVRHFPLLADADLDRWIRQRAGAKGVGVSPQAVALLATYMGPNLRLLDQELEKLATYLGREGSIAGEDVERLVSSLQEANIFHMVDALGSRRRRRALALLQRLFEEENAPLYILAMMVRQFRLLLQARELDAQGVPVGQMAREMEVRGFVARKCLRQATNFRREELQTILEELLDIDVGIKTGRLEGALALELFVVRWAGRE
jgi:DNA polymerase-3 subunit delta